MCESQKSHSYLHQILVLLEMYHGVLWMSFDVGQLPQQMQDFLAGRLTLMLLCL
jgi:hypothetical protein